MWITGFDVPSLTYMYNDKPLKKHLLIQTISRVNRKYPGKEFAALCIRECHINKDKMEIYHKVLNEMKQKYNEYIWLT